MASINMAAPRRLPELRATATGPQLFVHGRPFLCLPGELHNSSFSSAAYMKEQWTNLKRMNINTILGAVSWEMIEPFEGCFDFSELDQIIFDAREQSIHVILLWFGSYKNGLSTYVPSWVKKDSQRFTRVHIRCEESNTRLKTIEMLSPFNHNNCEADTRAFVELMKHLKEVDGSENTVIMVQVENEPGLLGDSRDRSSNAEKAFRDPIPLDFLSKLRERDVHDQFKQRFPNAFSAASSSSWDTLFGQHADEMLMAYAISKYVGRIAEAGKAAYGLPLFTNAWLNCDDPKSLDLEGVPLKHNMSTVAGGGAKAGDYPSGGACPHALDFWKINASALDFLAPDIYLHNYEWVCQQYRATDNALFIPEQRREETGARRIMLAYGTYGAIGCSPFGVDSQKAEESSFSSIFGLLKAAEEEIHGARARGPGSMMGFFFDEISRKDGPEQWTRIFPGFELLIQRAFVFGVQGPGCGIIISQEDGSFLLLGWGFRVTFKSTDPNSTFTGILKAEEKYIDESGNLRTLRRMNGDETRSGECYIMPNDNPDYGGFPIAITIPAKTYMAQVKPYSISE
ncbi:hypothetical protein FH972_022551 [Carpinus fangiana]|uniref:Beta-galactosidase n=1 Tax=Carpinus fangiana TaxID=176857 RepID=A0A5N6KT42_9ROSI|nr:hypothetical protein FH972_022551 [Carpinus fangiana]